MLESIGVLAIIAVIIYFFAQKQSTYDSDKRILGELIKNSRKCQNLINEYNNSVSQGKPIMTHRQLSIELERIVKEPNEQKEIAKNISAIEELNNRYKENLRKWRKVGYKYEDELFQIFDTNREMFKEDIIKGIYQKYRLKNLEEAENIFQIWKTNHLINECSWNEIMWEVGEVFTNEVYKIDKNDRLRNDWLEENGKVLKPYSKEYNDYFGYDDNDDYDDLPF